MSRSSARRKGRELPSARSNSESSRAPVVSIDREPQITIETFSRGSRDPIMHAFIRTERLERAHTRKMTREAWQCLYDAFVAAPR